MHELIQELSRRFPLRDFAEKRPGQAYVHTEKDHAETLIRELRDRAGFTHLAFLTAIDYIERGIFTLTYMLHHHERHWTLGVHVDIARDQAEMHSIHALWAQAATYQRELREMFGIRFPGSPRLDDDFILEGWEDIPPMRREFDTATFSVETFGDLGGRTSADPRQHMHQELYPNRGGDQ